MSSPCPYGTASFVFQVAASISDHLCMENDGLVETSKYLWSLLLTISTSPCCCFSNPAKMMRSGGGEFGLLGMDGERKTGKDVRTQNGGSRPPMCPFFRNVFAPASERARTRVHERQGAYRALPHLVHETVSRFRSTADKANIYGCSHGLHFHCQHCQDVAGSSWSRQDAC